MVAFDVSRAGARLVRINPQDDGVPRGQIALRGGAAASLLALRTALRDRVRPAPE
jgi:hypothetical protein